MIGSILIGLFCLALLAVSAFFSGSETALFALDSRQRHFLRKRQDLPARRVASLLSEQNEVLVAVLIGNTFVNILLAVLATRIFINLLGTMRGIATSSVIVTLTILIFGEILPKTLAVRSPLSFSLRIARPLLRVQVMLHALTRFFRRFSRGLLHVIERILPPDNLEMHGEDMRALFSLAEEEGGMGRKERELADGVFELGETKLSEIMTPRVDLFLLSDDTPLPKARRLMRRAAHSRAPVFSDNPDQVTGVISAATLFSCGDDTLSCGQLAQPPRFCPETQSALILLIEMLQEGTMLAIVLDEYGALEGLVTLEDLYEVLVGGVLGDMDDEDQRFYLVDENTLIASSRLDLDRAAELLNFPLASDEVESLGGYLMELVGEVPETGRVYHLGGLSWTVLSAVGPVIHTIKVEKES